MIRPASFCGCWGMKPSYGLISTEGIKVYAQSLDTIGWMGRSAADLARMARAVGVIEADPAPVAARALRIGYYEGPHWDRAAPETRAALAAAVAALHAAGATVATVQGPECFAGMTGAQDVIMHWEGRGAYRAEYLSHGAALHPRLRAEVENATRRTQADVRAAEDLIARGRVEFDAAFEGWDAWLTPAVIGEAPEGIASTGEAIFNRMWTALHGPCVNIPSAAGPNGLPVGVQIVSPRLTHAHLLAVAAALEPVLLGR